VERSGGHLRPMWAWGCVERLAAGLLGGPLAGGSRWSTAVAVGVTAAAGLALVAIVVSSRRSVGPRIPHTFWNRLCFCLRLPQRVLGCRGGLKSPWWRRRRKAPLTAQEWRDPFTPEGKLQDGGVKLLKKVRSGVSCGNS